MMVWLDSISEGIQFYANYVCIASLPFCILYMVWSQKINWMKFAIGQFFLLYICCVFTLVFLPLPSLQENEELLYRAQLVPLYCLYDLIFYPLGLFQIVFNVVLTLPFGIVLRYVFGLEERKIILYSLFFSLFIELGQLTGLFFTFQGSYRLFDVDDLVCNTLGGYFGYRMVLSVEDRLPGLSSFNRTLEEKPIRKQQYP